MKRSKVIAAFLLIGVMAVGAQMISVAQSESVTSSVTISNQAVFISLTTPYTDPGPAVTSTDVEQGFTSLGTATVNVDATSVHTVSSTTNFGGTTTAAPGGATFTSTNTEFTACELNLDSAGFVAGDPGPSNGSLAITTGTSGTDHTVGLQVDWTQYSDAPNGSYTCDVQITVTD